MSEVCIFKLTKDSSPCPGPWHPRRPGPGPQARSLPYQIGQVQAHGPTLPTPYRGRGNQLQTSRELYTVLEVPSPISMSIPDATVVFSMYPV